MLNSYHLLSNLLLDILYFYLRIFLLYLHRIFCTSFLLLYSYLLSFHSRLLDFPPPVSGCRSALPLPSPPDCTCGGAIPSCPSPAAPLSICCWCRWYLPDGPGYAIKGSYYTGTTPFYHIAARRRKRCTSLSATTIPGWRRSQTGGHYLRRRDPEADDGPCAVQNAPFMLRDEPTGGAGSGVGVRGVPPLQSHLRRTHLCLNQSPSGLLPLLRRDSGVRCRPAGQPSAAAGGGGSMPSCGTLRRSMIPMPCDALSFQVYQVISHDGRYPPEALPPGDIFCHFPQADCFSRRLH